MPTEHYTTGEADEVLADLNARLTALEQDAEIPVPPDPLPEPDTELIYGYAHTNRDKLEKDTGVLVRADRIFEGGLPSHISQTKVATLPDRYTPFLSVKASLTDPPLSTYRSLAESIDRPTVLIYRHEPENDGAKSTDFVTAQVRLSEVLADVDNEYVHMAICLMTSWASKSASQGGSIGYIPDASELAVPCGLCWDGYRHEGRGDETPEQIYADPKQLVDAAGLAWWGVMETAAETNAASWVRDVTDWCRDEGARACLYWPSQTSDAGSVNWYPPSSAFDEFADVALTYGGDRITSRYAV